MVDRDKICAIFLILMLRYPSAEDGCSSSCGNFEHLSAVINFGDIFTA
jgi:hypothetical protein